MKFTAICFLVILGLSAASPVEQVVNLLTKLKDTIIADGKSEQQIYDKYACWCDTTSHRKAQEIADGSASLRSLGQKILTLKGKVATLASEIEELATEIKEIEEQQEDMTATREKENAAWAAEAAETQQALAALQDAIKVLADATNLAQTSNGKTALIQGAQHLRMKSAVADVLNKLPEEFVGVPASRLSLLAEFTSESSKSTYAPQSATIQGMLQDMYTTFAANLEEATTTEAKKNFQYEDLFAELEEQQNAAKALKAKKEGIKAETESLLAETTKEFDLTTDEKAADIKFFDVTKKACEEKNEEWVERVRNRNLELDGVKKALEILSGDEARALFASAIKPGVETFLQVDSKPSKSSLLQDSATATNRAYLAIREQARKTHNVALAALAVSIRTTKVGHFDKVIDAIDKVISDLKAEEAADIAKKDECKTKYQEIGKTVAKLEWDIKNNKAKIAKLESLIEEDTLSKEEAIEKKGETEDYMKKISDERDAAHLAFKAAVKEDEDAISVLESARDALAKFYKKEGVELGKIQGEAKGALLQKEPEFSRSADDAPDATFSDKGNNKMQSKNILSIMQYLIEDLYDEISNGKKAEEKAVLDFQAETEAAQSLVDDLADKISDLKQAIADKGEDKSDEGLDMKKNNGLLDDENDYKAKITPDCDWIIGAFTKRADARAAEMNGLVTAKEYLAGQASLAQKPAFDDTKLRSLGFLGLVH